VKRASDSTTVKNTLLGLAALAGRELNEYAWALLKADLSHYGETEVLTALERFRRESKGFPCLADIIERIPDGRPGGEEAWAMLPKDEAASVVWTAEMSEAYGIVRELMGQDMIAARRAFLETYERLCAESRAKRRPAQWVPSLGHDRTGRVTVLQEAARKGRLSASQVEAFLPPPETPKLKQLTGPAEPELSAVDPTVMLAAIREQIAKRGSA
jgi:hypothetical protein